MLLFILKIINLFLITSFLVIDRILLWFLCELEAYTLQIDFSLSILHLDRCLFLLVFTVGFDTHAAMRLLDTLHSGDMAHRIAVVEAKVLFLVIIICLNFFDRRGHARSTLGGEPRYRSHTLVLGVHNLFFPLLIQKHLLMNLLDKL